MNIKDTMETVQRALDDYEQSLSLPIAYPPGPDAELSQYLTMERSLIQSLTPTDCAEIECRLLQYSFYLRRCINKENSRLKWCDAKLNEFAANSYRDISDVYGNFDYKLNILAKSNDVIASLLKVKNYAEQRCARLNELSKGIELIASSLKNNQIAKVSEGRHG